MLVASPLILGYDATASSNGHFSNRSRVRSHQLLPDFAGKGVLNVLVIFLSFFAFKFAEFCDNRFRGFGVLTPRISPFSLGIARPYNGVRVAVLH